MKYTTKLQSIIKKNNSNVVIGLDPDLNKLPAIFMKYKNPVAEFNKLIINSTKDIVAGYKPNMAFYECLAEQGIEAIRETVEAIPEDMITICDAKRGDMGNTAEMYARIYLDNYNFDSITLSPYMGEDSIAPFIKNESKGVYIIALTSNPGAKNFQYLMTNGKPLYEVVVEKCLEWNKLGNIGFVFGANHSSELKKFTESNPEVPLLIPGVGAQESDLDELLKNLNTKNFVINSSRNIIYSASKDCTETEFTESVRHAAIALNDNINTLIQT
ncbi:MAG: orotidine-5'-phosphate decarboxylase [bacterium]